MILVTTQIRLIRINNTHNSGRKYIIEAESLQIENLVLAIKPNTLNNVWAVILKMPVRAERRKRRGQ